MAADMVFQTNAPEMENETGSLRSEALEAIS